MLELTDGGRCMSGMDAIEFFERIGDVIEDDAKTEDFCDELTWAINRLRYEVSKSVPIEPVKEKGRLTVYKCGRCGIGIRPDLDVFCPKCGRQIGWGKPSAMVEDAVEVVRCRECRWYKPAHFKADDGTELSWDGAFRIGEGRSDGIYTGSKCKHERNTAYGQRDMAFRRPDDFCSYGERRGDNG